MLALSTCGALWTIASIAANRFFSAHTIVETWSGSTFIDIKFTMLSSEPWWAKTKKMFCHYHAFTSMTRVWLAINDRCITLLTRKSVSTMTNPANGCNFFTFSIIAATVITTVFSKNLTELSFVPNFTNTHNRPTWLHNTSTVHTAWAHYLLAF